MHERIPKPVVFPLYKIVNGKCACGVETCARVGKHPKVAWGDIEYEDAITLPEPGAGQGLKTGAYPLGSDILVVDLDTEEAAQLWDTKYTGPPTLTIATGRGVQLYYQHPGFRVRNSASDFAPGVDIRGDGGFVVAPGSPHKNGKTYDVIVDAPIQPAPEWLIEWLQSRPAVEEVQNYAGDVTGEELLYHRRLYTEYLKAAPPCIQGQGGDAQLWRVVQKGAYDLALPVHDVFELLNEHFDPKCIPPWGDELQDKVERKALGAKTASTRPRLQPMPEDLELLMRGSSIAEEARAQESPAPVPTTVEEIEKALNITWGQWDEEIEPPRYLVRDIVPEESVGMLVAKGSSLKTWMALSLAIAVANGHPWLGTYEVRKANALIIDFESGTWQLRNRSQILGRFSSPGLAHANFPSGRIDDVKFWEQLVVLTRARELGLVIIDSFAAGAAGVDENDARAALPLHLASRFSTETKCSVVFIHHGKKGDTEDERDVARGTGAVYAGVDWMFKLDPLNDERTKMLVRCNKPWGPKPADFGIELTLTEGLVISQAMENTSAEDRSAKILEFLDRGPARTLGSIARGIGAEENAIKDEIKALEIGREIAILPGVGFVRDNPQTRLARIVECCQLPGVSTPKQIATEARVEAKEVYALIKKAVLVKSSEGYEYYPEQ